MELKMSTFLAITDKLQLSLWKSVSNCINETGYVSFFYFLPFFFVCLDVPRKIVTFSIIYFSIISVEWNSQAKGQYKAKQCQQN